MKYVLRLNAPMLFTWILLLACSIRPAYSQGDDPIVESTLSVYDLETGKVRTVYTARDHFEAPNWTLDGEALIFNSGGQLFRIPVEGGEPERIETGTITRINNDHGITPDGETLIISAGSPSQIYTLLVEGGTPVQITQEGPSYWHGVSPDGETLAYVARRGVEYYDLYTIPISGGEETRLTSDEAHDDGPDYSPDGRYMYWNSDRAGNFDIWRLPLDGGEAEQVTSDAWEDWFPHPSPDGEHIVMLSYEPGTEGHPANQHVKLRMIRGDGTGAPQDLVDLFGGQGTINVPSWSPDSRAFAFVQYRLIEE